MRISIPALVKEARTAAPASPPAPGTQEVCLLLEQAGVGGGAGGEGEELNLGSLNILLLLSLLLILFMLFLLILHYLLLLLAHLGSSKFRLRTSTRYQPSPS